jgi:hypothetical protein
MAMYMRCIPVVGLLILISPMCYAQLDNHFLSDKITHDNTEKKTLSLDYTQVNYLRNTEYFNAVEKGRTLMGVQLIPVLHYQPNKRMSIRTGAYIRSEFGATPSLYEVLPVISLKLFSASGKTSLTLGTLEGALSHGLIEPLFNINSAILRRIENGAQFKVNSKYIFSDTWLNWEKFIEPGSAHKEQLTAGVHTYLNLTSADESWVVRPVVQVTVFHRGGQIDADTSAMVTVANYATGAQLIKKWANEQATIRAEAYMTGYTENTRSGNYPFRNGSGVMVNAGATFHAWSLLATYWSGNNWIAPRGTSIYQSVSEHDPLYTQKMRKLIIPRLCYQTEWLDKQLTCVARFEPVYDAGSRTTEFSFSLYLCYSLRQAITR